MRKGPSHIPALDGLRGIAVLLVMLFHFSWAFAETPVASHLAKRAMWTGWVGVDLFFVLSGYLITRGLAAPSSRALGERLRLFWARRSLRIFPLYFAALLVGAGLCMAVGARMPELSYWVYFQNYALAFDPDPERWTSHLWSLAVEEQFYLAWPLFVLFLRRRSAIIGTVALLVAGAALRTRLMMGTGHWDALTSAKLAYRALPTHMDGLLLGSLLALIEGSRLADLWRAHRAKATVVSGIALAGLVMWTRGFQFYDRRVVVLGYGVLAFFFTCVVSYAVDDRLPAFLSARPLRAVGRVSYGMYLLHWPLIALAIPSLKHVELPFAVSVAVTAAGIGATYVLATASYLWVEAPFYSLKDRFQEWTAPAMAVADDLAPASRA